MNEKEKQNTEWVDNSRKQFILKQMEIINQKGSPMQMDPGTKNSIVLQSDIQI
jgi:hypothetical protein